MSEIEAIVLAGGKGSRLHELTKDLQKCLLPIDEEPVLGHIMQSLVAAFGSVDLTVAIGYKGEQVVDYVNYKKPRNMNVAFVPHIPGTEGWGIYRAMRGHVSGRFVATPGDIVALPEVYERVLEAFDHTSAALAFSPDMDVVDTHGVGRISGGMASNLQWPRPEGVEGYCCDMTIWASDPTFFDLLEDYPSPRKSIGVAFSKIIGDGWPVSGIKYEKPWIHLGYSSDLNKTMFDYPFRFPLINEQDKEFESILMTSA